MRCTTIYVALAVLALTLQASALCVGQPGVRINKVFTASFSRRESDRVVADGRVTINGKVATPGDRLLPGDVVTLDGKPFEAAFDGYSESVAAEHIYIKYWKPRGVTCTTDPHIDGNIIDAVNHPGPARLFPVGRLDKDSEGLILLTNDGRVPNSVNRAAFAKEKLYDVTCSRALSDSHLRQLSRGVVITTTAQRDRGPAKVLTAPTRPCKVERTGSKSFRIVLTEGRNRQIRRMCQALGFTVTRLHRLEVMGIGLRGLEGPGDWVDLGGEDEKVVTDAIASAEAQGPDADVRRQQQQQQQQVQHYQSTSRPAARGNRGGGRGRGRAGGRGRGRAATAGRGGGRGRGGSGR